MSIESKTSSEARFLDNYFEPSDVRHFNAKQKVRGFDKWEKSGTNFKSYAVSYVNKTQSFKVAKTACAFCRLAHGGP